MYKINTLKCLVLWPISKSGFSANSDYPVKKKFDKIQCLERISELSVIDCVEKMSSD